ncbi:MAG: hypothetical protein R3E32_19825 [Chitinophagales bacterium]
MKKLLFLIICLLAANGLTQAQNYDAAVGIRFGFPTGITYKQFMGGNTAFEVIVGGGDKGGSVTALIEFHSEVLDQSLNVFYGLGGHIGTWRSDLNVGVDGIFGLELSTSSPIVMAIDIKPTVFLWRSDIRTSTGGAFSLRYSF